MQHLTCFMPHPLDASRKVHRLSDCQLWEMQIDLLNVGCCPLWDEALEGDAIVRDLPCDLQCKYHLKPFTKKDLNLIVS